MSVENPTSIGVASDPISEAKQKELAPGITTAERAAVLGLIDPETGYSHVENSQNARQVFNYIVTTAIFGKETTNWNHSTFDRSKKVITLMAAHGEIELIFDQMYAIVGIKLPGSDDKKELTNEIDIDPRDALIIDLIGKLAAASQKLDKEREYHQTADAMLDPLLSENETLRTKLATAEANLTEQPDTTDAADLNVELTSVKIKLHTEQSRTKNLQELVDHMRERHTQTERELKSTRSELRRTLSILATALGYSKLTSNDIAEAVRATKEDLVVRSMNESASGTRQLLKWTGLSDVLNLFEAYSRGQSTPAQKLRTLLMEVVSLDNEAQQMSEGAPERLEVLRKLEATAYELMEVGHGFLMAEDSKDQATA